VFFSAFFMDENKSQEKRSFVLPCPLFAQKKKIGEFQPPLLLPHLRTTHEGTK
jgi:hypothetical protein